MKYINNQIFDEASILRYHQEFKNAEPFPNIVFDNFLKEDVANAMYEHFPKVEDLRKHYKNINENKSEGSSFDQYHEAFNKVRHELMDSEFITILEKVTGIEGLSLPDDHRGSGLHQGINGSYLDVHVDFSVHPILNLHRRLNLLIFLNKKWEDSYGGHLELWDENVKNCYQNITPSFNRCAIFETSDVSYHGYSKINVPENVTRKSMFAYFYTPLSEGVKYHDTIFKARPTESTAKKAMTAVKETGKNTVKKMLKTLGMKGLFEKYE